MNEKEQTQFKHLLQEASNGLHAAIEAKQSGKQVLCKQHVDQAKSALQAATQILENLVCVEQ